MALEQKSKQIGEFSYEVTTLGAKLADRVALKLAKNIGPVFLMMAGAGKSLSADAFKGISEDDYEWIVDQLAKSTCVTLGDRAPSLASVYDLHFAGKPTERLEWLQFAIEVNFGPFFLVLRQKTALAGARSAAGTIPTPSSSPSPST